MAIDPRLLDPSYWASLPIQSGVLPSFGGAGQGSVTAFPTKFLDSQTKGLLDLYNGKSWGLFGSHMTPFNQDYILKPSEAVKGLAGNGEWDVGYKKLSELGDYFDFSSSDPVFSSLSPTAQSYLSKTVGSYDPFDVSSKNLANWAAADAKYGTWKPNQIAAQFTPQDYSTIDAAIQPYRTADQLYVRELLSRVQRGDIKLKSDDKDTGFMGGLFASIPAIVGTAVGGPIGGAIGGAISAGISGGGLKGALTGALTGGIAGAGGIGSVAGKALGSTSAGGGLMNSITSGLRSVANSQFNPFNYLSGGIQGLFGSNALTQGLGSALSLGGPGALLGGALGGKQGALLGGLGGAGLGLDLDDVFGGGGLFGRGGLFSGGGGLFGGGASSGASSGAGGSAGGGGQVAGGSGLLNSLFGGDLGGLGQLLAGGVPLALLTREAEKASNTPTGSRTPFSSVNNGVANLDPNIRNVLLESIDNTRGELGRAKGNQNAFIQARVNPLQEQIGQQRGALQRSIGLRGLSGSSFGDQAMRSFGLDSERALGDARSQATQEALGFESQLNQLLQGGGMNLLQSELSALGLGNLEIQNLIARAKLRTDLFGRAADQTGHLLGGRP